MFKRCRKIKDKDCQEGFYIIPKCWGSAIYGEHRCICPPPPKKLTKKMKAVLGEAAALNMDAGQVEEFVRLLKLPRLEFKDGGQSQ